MSGHEIKTEIGEDVPVTVYFDYQPYESATLEYPGCDAEVTINAVEVDADPDYDILDCLSKGWIQTLSERCMESLNEGEE